VEVQTGDIIQRCTTDVDTLRNFLEGHFLELIRIACILIIAVVAMFSMDVIMAISALALVPVVVVISAVIFSKLGKEFQKAEVADGELQACAQENYTGVRVVRAFGRERFEVERFQQKSAKLANLWSEIGKFMGTFWGIGDILTGLQLLLIVAVGILRASQGLVSPGTFLAFYTYANMFMWPVRQLGRIITEFSKAKVATTRLLDILKTPIESDPVDALEPVISGQVEFSHVTFGYTPEQPILKDVSFVMHPGQTLAILGATGTGKSTLAHLIARLYDVPEGQGTIKIDSIDVRSIQRHHLRKHVGIVLQEPFLFSKTIRENITTLTPGATGDQMEEAAKVAHIHESILSFGEGYDTIIGERGVTLSGGQKQRVAIARTLIAKNPILIFDDSLSAVDTETDAAIRKALRKQTKDASVMIISHRMSTLMQADQIMVLKNGSVEEIGSHQELMASGGSYRRIFDLQASILTEEDG
jgi:ATP-binding cassette subfamily B protein